MGVPNKTQPARYVVLGERLQVVVRTCEVTEALTLSARFDQRSGIGDPSETQFYVVGALLVFNLRSSASAHVSGTVAVTGKGSLMSCLLPLHRTGLLDYACIDISTCYCERYNTCYVLPL